MIIYFISGFILIILLLVGPKVARMVIGFSWSRMCSLITPMFVTVTGRENIEKRRSYVIISNHQSHYDIFVLHGWLLVDIIWVMKKELRKIPIFGYICEKTEQIYIDRSNREAAKASLEEAKKRIVDGTSVIFFAEGTRSKTGRLGEFKKGAFRMALDLNIPILPVTIINTEKILPAKTFRLFPGRAKMIIHKPIEISNYSHDTIEDLTSDIKNIIQRNLD